MIRNTAYDTVAEYGFASEKNIINSLQKCLINNTLTKEEIKLESGEILYYYLVESSECEVIKFDHPILIETFEKDKYNKPIKAIVADVRNFGKYDVFNVKFNVKNKPEYELAKNRAILNTLWLIDEYKYKLENISPLPAKIYSTTITELIGRRYNLAFDNRVIISIISCYFYYNLFTNSKVYSDSEYQNIIKKISLHLKPIPIENIYNVLDNLDKKVILDISELIDIIKKECVNEALNNLDLGIFTQLFNGLWYSATGRNVLLTSVELPPLWILLCHTSLTEETYKKLMFSSLTQKYKKDKEEINSFTKSLQNLLLPNTDY